MKAVIYARYSSDSQREESIEGQLRECLEFANKIGVDVVANYIDRAMTAMSDNRPDFQRMIKDSYKHCFDMIIVWKLDRFSRDRYDSAHYKHILKKNGVKVVSAKENISEGPEGIILESMLEGMAEYYSAELSVKVKRGLKENALKAKVNGGQIPFGYYIDEEQKHAIDQTLAPIVVEAFTMYADGYLIKDIVNHFNAKGITTRLGKKMSYNIVQYMLTNRKYIGEFRYNDIVIPDAVPAIVSKDLFERVQRRMAQNKHAPARHKAEDDYLLTTKLFCGKCGALMVGEAGTGRKKEVHRYYKCVNAKKHTCDKKTVRKLWIEDLAVQKAMELLHDEAVTDYLVDRIFDLQGEENPRLPRLRLQLEDVENRIKNIITAIEQGIIFDSTKDRLAELEKEKSQLDLTIIQEQIKKLFLTKEQIRFGIEKFKKLNISTKEGKQRLIDGFINAIYLYDDKITFTFNYKDGTKTVFLSELNCTPSGSDLKCLGAPFRVEITDFVISTFLAYLSGKPLFFCFLHLGKSDTAVRLWHLSLFPQTQFSYRPVNHNKIRYRNQRPGNGVRQINNLKRGLEREYREDPYDPEQASADQGNDRRNDSPPQALQNFGAQLHKGNGKVGRKHDNHPLHRRLISDLIQTAFRRMDAVHGEQRIAEA